MALAAGITATPSAELSALLAASNGRVLAVQDGLNDALEDHDTAAWAGAAEQLDRWLTPLPAMLRQGGLDEVRLYPCDGSGLVLRRADLAGLRRLLPRLPWQRPRSLAARATAPVAAP